VSASIACHAISEVGKIVPNFFAVPVMDVLRIVKIPEQAPQLKVRQERAHGSLPFD